MNWTDGDVTIDGVRIHYYRRGSGRPLVLAHGASDNGKCWERVAARLEDRFDIIAYDARYHGLSDGPEGGSLNGAPDRIALVKALGLERPAAMGHSMGAATVAEAVGAEPALFRCAVLEDPPWRDEFPSGGRRPQFDMGSLTVEQIAESGRKQSPTWDASEFPAWAESKKQFRPPADTMSRIGKMLGTWRETVKKIGVPTLLVTGDNAERGAIVSKEAAADAVKLNPKVETICLSGAGHNVRREAFEEFVAAVEPFLER
jgi:pimeloyl-ACP methyl ester carboxylesterase